MRHVGWVRSGQMEMECHALEFLPNPNRARESAPARARRAPRQAAGEPQRAYPGTSLPLFSLPEGTFEVVNSLEALARMRGAVLGLGDRVLGQNCEVLEEAACAFSREHACPAVSGWSAPAQAVGADRGSEGSGAGAEPTRVVSQRNATGSGAQAEASQCSPSPAGPASAFASPSTAHPPHAWAAAREAGSAHRGQPGAGDPAAAQARGFGTAARTSAPEAHHATEGSDSAYEPGSGPGLYPAVVGIDAEWEPGSREAPPGPVSLLQIATRRHVYLVDVLWFCGPEDAPACGRAGDRGAPCSGGAGERVAEPGGGGARACAAEADSEDSAVGTERSNDPSGSSAGMPSASTATQFEGLDGRARGTAAGSPNSWPDLCSAGNSALASDPEHKPGPRLSERARALSNFLGELLAAAHVVKAGFGLNYDLRRLAESYPDLPCFGSAGDPAAAVRSHVDVLKLARAAFPAGQQVPCAPAVLHCGARLWPVMGLMPACKCCQYLQQALPHSCFREMHSRLFAFEFLARLLHASMCLHVLRCNTFSTAPSTRRPCWGG